MNAHGHDPENSGRDSREGIAAQDGTVNWQDIPTGLARLAFAETDSADAAVTVAPRHLALMQPDAMNLDLHDPAQRRFGDYDLLEKIGEGGMGVIYRARQSGLDRDVAIKLLAAGPWASREFIERFKREAQNAARLQHPNIVAIHEIGSQDGLNYFSMRLVQGPSLAQELVRRGVYEPFEAARLLRKITEALDYAHRLGVLHLDLKPHNVLIDEQGEPLVADFGLARRLDESFATDVEEVSGTPSYMAPEQAVLKSHKLSPATDIYGLGAILYEVLSGKPPFVGATARDTLERVVHEQVPDLRSRRPGIPADLAAICMQCLAKAPAERYASARELADDLCRFLDRRPVSVRPLNAMQRIGRWARREPRTAAAIVACAAALVFGLIATSLQWRRAESNAHVARSTLWSQRHETAWRLFQEQRHFDAMTYLAANLREQVASGDHAAAADERRRLAILQNPLPALLDALDVGAAIHVLAISPDGRFLALGLQPYTVALYDLSTHRQIWRVRLRTHPGEETDGQLRRLQFTPDGKYLLVWRHWSMLQIRPGGLHMWRLALVDGAQTDVPDAAHVSSETWSDDGRQVLLLDAELRHYRLWQADPWRPLSPVAGDAPMQQFRPGWLIAPNRRFIAMAYRPDEGVRILDPTTLETRHVIAPSQTGARFVAWAISPDAHTLALAADSGQMLLVEPDSGAARTLRQNLYELATWVSFSADGAWLGVSLRSGDFFLYSLPDGQLQNDQLRPAQVWGHQLECKSDRCTVLLMEWDRVTMWQWAGRTEVPGNPLAGGSVMLAPEISHNGYVARFASAFNLDRRVLATGGQDGSLKIWRLPTDPLRGALAPTQREQVLRFDDTHLVGVDGRQVWVQDADTGALRSPRMQVEQPVGFAALSADGRDLLVSSGRVLHVFDWRSGKDRIAPIALPGTPASVLLGADGHTAVLRWTLPAGTDAEVSRIQAYDLRTGRPQGRGGDMRNFTEAELSADSSRLLVTAEDGSGLYALSDLSRPLQRFPAPDPSHHVEHAIFDRGDEGIVQFVGDKDETVNAVQRWTTAGRLLHSQTVLVNAHSLIVRPRDGRVAIIGDRGGNASSYSLNLLLDRDGSTHPLTLPRQTEMEHAQALSADGRVLAQAMSNGVLLVDMDSGQNLGPALQYPMDTSERIAQLAFSPDNDRLLARTTYGRWLLWNLTPDRRPADMIADEGAQVAPLAGTAFTPPSPALRASWRARDSATAAQVPQPSAWSCLPPNGAIPPRAADTPSPLLDLSAQFTAPLHRVSLASTSVRERSLGNLCVLPLGVQRFAGIDFDVRGVVELRSDPSHPGSHSTARSGPLSVDVAPGRYERVHVLGAVTSSTTGRDDEVGRLRWVYRDGGFRELPLRLGNADAPTPGGDDHTHVAWYGAYGESQVVASGGAAAALFATDIGNPEPDREIARIELRVTADIVNDGNLSIVAITLDPAAGALPPLTTRSKTASATQPVIVTR